MPEAWLRALTAGEGAAAPAEAPRPFPGQGNPRDEEVARLRRELARVKEENDILKKAVGIFTSRPT